MKIELNATVEWNKNAAWDVWDKTKKEFLLVGGRSFFADVEDKNNMKM